MKFQIDISDQKLGSATEPAKRQLVKVVAKFGEELVDEATRQEATYRTAANPEITATHINDAHDIVRRYGRRKEKPRIFLKSAAAIGMLLTGSFFDGTKFDELTYSLPYATLFIFTTVCQILLFVKNSSDD